MDSTALALTLTGFGVLLIVISYQRHRHHRDVSALLHGVGGALLFLCGALLLALALNFNTYDRLTPDQPLAELSIEQAGPQTYHAHLMRIPAGDLQVFTLTGDHWQLQAHLLQWHRWAQWLGLSANIRLEQLISTAMPGKASSRNTATRAVQGISYTLSANPGISLWTAPQQHRGGSGVLDTQVLETDSLPLQDGMRFHVYLSDGHLMARAINLPKAIKQLNATATGRSKVGVTPVGALNADSPDVDVDTDEADAIAAPGSAAPNASPP
jgi:hypothetical protein